MEETPLPYAKWVEDSLRGVVRRALSLVEARGLPGDHHFYITFRTRGDGVRIPARLRAQHADEMTIVLQNQFWDLEVEDDAFSVTLNFSRISERLSIPFAAITTFADPDANFVLPLNMALGASPRDAAADQDPAAADEAAAGEASVDGDDDGEAQAGEVIALDAFRKK